jgi:hypothetical protein
MRPKHIPTPEKMWELFEGYRTWCKSTPRYSYSLSTKTGEATAIPLERPLTQVGFRTYAADKECSVKITLLILMGDILSMRQSAHA